MQWIPFLENLDLKLLFTLDTHVHADHISSSYKLHKKTACKIAMSASTKAEFVSLHLKDKESLNIGDIKLETIHTPGHTDDSCSFFCGDRVFTGDTLLIGSTGRCDFQNGDSSLQYDSIFNKLLKLPESTFVYPAHDYNGFTVSTIKEEKAFNPRLQVKSKEEYINILIMNSLPPLYPSYSH